MKTTIKLFLLAALAASLSSCADVVPSYTVTNDGTISGEQWEAGKQHVIPAQNVSPNIDFRLPQSIGGGSVRASVSAVPVAAQK